MGEIPDPEQGKQRNGCTSTYTLLIYHKVLRVSYYIRKLGVVGLRVNASACHEPRGSNCIQS